MVSPTASIYNTVYGSAVAETARFFGTRTNGDTLWATTDSLMKYDITILSCEGGGFEEQKPLAVREAMYDYESKGGRVFASHWHNIWFEKGPDPVPTTGTWNTRMPNPAGTAQNENGDGTPQPATINQTFPKGEALAKWLLNVGASTTLGQMNVEYPRDNIQAVNPALAREWILSTFFSQLLQCVQR